MNNNQMFFALASLILALFGIAKLYFDAKIDGKIDGLRMYMDARFTALDGQVKFVLDHTFNFGERR